MSSFRTRGGAWGALAGVLFVGSIGAGAWGQCASVNITAGGGSPGDVFGSSVAVHADVLVVGASGDDDLGGIDQGSVGVFRWSPTGWGSEVKLLASDGAGGDAFGAAVAVYGRWIAVGAPGRDVASSNEGAVYIFELRGNTWVEVARLTAPDAGQGDTFGAAVGMDDGRLVVGAPMRDVNGNSNQGAVYVFKYSLDGWTLEAELVAGDGAAVDRFGGDVDISGGRIIVGAKDADIGGNLSQGAAYVYSVASGTWTQEVKLLAASGAAQDVFGATVAISGSYAVVGAPQRDGVAGTNTGSAFVFRYTPITAWQQVAELTGHDQGDAFGWDVDIVQDRLGVRVLVGARSDDIVGLPGLNQGSVHYYTNVSDGAIPAFSFNDPAGATSDQFGHAVALSPQFMVVGVPGDDPPGGSSAGSVWVLDPDKIVPRAASAGIPPLVSNDPNASVGTSVTVNNLNEFFVGAPRTNVGGLTDVGVFLLYPRGADGLRGPVVYQHPAPVAGALFGMAMTSGGNLLTVSAPGEAKVYTYSRNLETLNPPTVFAGPTGIQWGYALAESGSVMVVGATGGASGRGQVYSYARTGNTWTQQAVVESPDASALNFGVAVAKDGNTMIVGDDQIADGTTLNEGAAYVFVRSGTTWSLQQKLTLPGPNVTNAGFGRAVALREDRAAVSSTVSSTSGQVHIFERVGTTWSHAQTINVGANAVAALDTDMLAIAEHSSKLRLYRRFSGEWQLATPPLSVSSSVNRYAVALRNGVAVLGGISGAFDTEGVVVSLYIPDCVGRVDNDVTGEGFSSIAAAIAAASPGDDINASSYASLIGLDRDVTVNVQGPIRVPRGTTASLGDGNMFMSQTSGTLGCSIFGTVRMIDFRRGLLGEGSAPVEAGPSSVIDIRSGCGLRIPGHRISLFGTITVEPAGALFLQPVDETTSPRALVNHGVINLRGVIEVFEQSTSEFKVFYNGGDGTISGYGDLVGDFVNEGAWTVLADMQLVGALTNTSLITVQNGTFSILGTLTNHGSIIGDICCRGGGGMFVQGDFVLGAGASLEGPGAGFRLNLGSHFDCAIDDNDRFDMAGAEVRVNGLGAEQRVEAMSRDIGPDPAGLDRSMEGHFPIGTLRIGPARAVARLVDERDNDGRGQKECEAIYCDTLIIEAGATLDTSGCAMIYYNTLENRGVVTDPTRLVRIAACSGDFNGDGLLNSQDFFDFLNEFFAGRPRADFNGDGLINSQDFFDFLAAFFVGC